MTFELQLDKPQNSLLNEKIIKSNEWTLQDTYTEDGVLHTFYKE